MNSSVKVIGQNKEEFNIEFGQTTSEGTINNEAFEWDVIEVKENSFHVIKNHKSYNVEVLKADYEEKAFFIKVNGEQYKFDVKDKFDELLHSLGMDNLTAGKVADVKAPMPGLVLEVSVNSGEEVKKGDALLILEAMKMENVIKSPADGVVKSISINKGDAVEKNQLMLSFE